MAAEAAAEGVRVEPLTAALTLGEGPHWDAGRQALFFVDIAGRTLHKWDPATRSHTYTSVEGRVGFIIPVEGAADVFVAGVEREVWALEWDGGQGAPARRRKLLAAVDGDVAGTRINDAKVDPKGRLFFGTMGKEEPPGEFARHCGSLYRLDAGAGGAVTRLAERVGISNGLAWDLARAAFYYIDSLERAVARYDYDADTGDISNRRVLFDLAAHDLGGFPDGMAADAAGRLWVANFDGSRVLCVDADSGRLLRTVALPALQVTSLAFGGAALDELYVTTASMQLGAAQRPPPPAGALLRVTGLGARGLPPHPLRLD